MRSARRMQHPAPPWCRMDSGPSSVSSIEIDATRSGWAISGVMKVGFMALQWLDIMHRRHHLSPVSWILLSLIFSNNEFNFHVATFTLLFFIQPGCVFFITGLVCMQYCRNSDLVSVLHSSQAKSSPLVLEYGLRAFVNLGYDNHMQWGCINACTGASHKVCVCVCVRVCGMGRLDFVSSVVFPLTFPI